VPSDLLAETAVLVGIPSVSHHESSLADYVERRLRDCAGLDVVRVGDNVVGRTHLGRASRVVFAGHLDTVPPACNAEPVLEGDALRGVGAADMKGGLAVMMALARRLCQPAHDVTYLFYVCEEVSREHNGLLAIEAADSSLIEGDVAVLGEPTACAVEAGCQGVLRAAVTLGGRRAHTARPWMGVNSIHRLVPILERVVSYEPRQPLIDGCRYREALQAVAVEGGVASNVVPDRSRLVLNHRFAPDRDAAAAGEWLRGYLELDPAQGDSMEVIEAQPAAPPALANPFLAALVDATGETPRAKLGWTDVAFFSERGIPAANFGPGDPELAHTPDERVELAQLERGYALLAGLLSGRS
jgi:succinyl-diaminopimelate desuccinylase